MVFKLNWFNLILKIVQTVENVFLVSYKEFWNGLLVNFCADIA